MACHILLKVKYTTLKASLKVLFPCLSVRIADLPQAGFPNKLHHEKALDLEINTGTIIFHENESYATIYAFGKKSTTKMAFLSHIFNFGVLDGALPTLAHLQWLSQLLYMLHESIFIRSFGRADTGMPEIQPTSPRPSGGLFNNITGCYKRPDAKAANMSWQYSHMSSSSPSSALSSLPSSSDSSLSRFSGSKRDYIRSAA